MDPATTAALTSVAVKSIPQLIEMASRLFRTADEPTKAQVDPHASTRDQLESIVKRIERSEALEVEQAKLVKQTIENLQQVALASAANSKAVHLAMGISVGSAIVAIMAVAVAILK